MDATPLFALTHAWWTWNHDRIRDALRATFLQHWVPIVDDALKQLSASEKPVTWECLSGEGLVRRDPHHLNRIKSGVCGFTAEVMLGFSSVLGIPLDQLHPTTEQWVAGAARQLCGGRISAERAKKYAAFMLRLLPSRALLVAVSDSEGMIESEYPTSAAAESVADVARILDPLLVAIDEEIRSRRARHEETDDR